jgi:endonuclease I
MGNKLAITFAYSRSVRLGIHLVFFLLFLVLQTFAQVPSYYQSIDLDSRGKDLASQLTALISETHVNQTVYTPGAWEALKIADIDPEKENYVLLIYGFNDFDQITNNDRTRHVDSSCHTSSCTGLWVREHVYPRSVGTPNLGFEGAGSDLHALHAIDDQRNNSRSNRPFGFGSGNSGITATANFYPGDEWKGDVARIIMYMHIRYPSQCPADRVGEGGSTFSDFDNMRDIFLIWNAQDPPSAHENLRNDHFFEKQGNRNPFIDNPHLATLIWNGPEALDLWSSSSTTQEILPEIKLIPNPASDYILLQGRPLSNTPIAIFSSLGTPVYSGIWDGHPIDVSSYHPGIYFMVIAPDNNNMQALPFVRR